MGGWRTNGGDPVWDTSTLQFEARFSNGSIGYIADPYALRRGTHHMQVTGEHHRFWTIFDRYAVAPTDETPSTAAGSSRSVVCGFGPGQGLEEEGGWKLLTEKIYTNPDSSRVMTRVKVLCAIYTHAPLHPLARAAALTWGVQCDGFLAFSTETIPELGFLDLVHNGPEAYGNMFQKVRSIWAYIYRHYRDQFDFFHLSGDDTYLLVNNLRLLTQQVQDTLGPAVPVHLGRWIRQKNLPYISGGPGYTLNRVALEHLALEGLPSCLSDKHASYEDRLISLCMQSIGILPRDTRQGITGEQRYHVASPHQAFITRVSPLQKRPSYQSKVAAFDQSLPLPSPYQLFNTADRLMDNGAPTMLGPRYGLQSAAIDSVAFHHINSPLYMSRMHAILYPELCPMESPLGMALRRVTLH